MTLEDVCEVGGRGCRAGGARHWLSEERKGVDDVVGDVAREQTRGKGRRGRARGGAREMPRIGFEEAREGDGQAANLHSSLTEPVSRRGYIRCSLFPNYIAFVFSFLFLFFSFSFCIIFKYEHGTSI